MFTALLVSNQIKTSYYSTKKYQTCLQLTFAVTVTQNEVFCLFFYLMLNQAVNFRFSYVSGEVDMSFHIIF